MSLNSNITRCIMSDIINRNIALLTDVDELFEDDLKMTNEMVVSELKDKSFKPGNELYEVMKGVSKYLRSDLDNIDDVREAYEVVKEKDDKILTTLNDVSGKISQSVLDIYNDINLNYRSDVDYMMESIKTATIDNKEEIKVKYYDFNINFFDWGSLNDEKFSYELEEYVNTRLSNVLKNSLKDSSDIILASIESIQHIKPNNDYVTEDSFNGLDIEHLELLTDSKEFLGYRIKTLSYFKKFNRFDNVSAILERTEALEDLFLDVSDYLDNNPDIDINLEFVNERLETIEKLMMYNYGYLKAIRKQRYNNSILLPVDESNKNEVYINMDLLDEYKASFEEDLLEEETDTLESILTYLKDREINQYLNKGLELKTLQSLKDIAFKNFHFRQEKIAQEDKNIHIDSFKKSLKEKIEEVTEPFLNDGNKLEMIERQDKFLNKMAYKIKRSDFDLKSNLYDYLFDLNGVPPSYRKLKEIIFTEKESLEKSYTQFILDEVKNKILN